MGRLLVVDGSDVCRAPIVEFALRARLGDDSASRSVEVVSRGVTAETGTPMCDSAASRIGFTGPAIAFYGAHRAARLTTLDIQEADLILTAERTQRSAVVRMLPGTQATVFTWKEALALTGVLVDRRSIVATPMPSDAAGLARALHGVRGTVPMLEPATRTGVFHWRRPIDTDPLTISGGHEGRAEHRRAIEESAQVAGALASRFAELLSDGEADEQLSVIEPRQRRLRRAG